MNTKAVSLCLLASIAVGGDGTNVVTDTMSLVDTAFYTVQRHTEHHTCDVCGYQWDTWHSDDSPFYLNTTTIPCSVSVSLGLEPIGYEPSSASYGVTLCEKCHAKHGEGLFKYLKGCRDTYIAALREKEAARRLEVAAEAKAAKIRDIDKRLAALMDEANTLREQKQKFAGLK